MKIKWKTLIIAIIIPLAIGGLASLITSGSMDIYENYKKPVGVPGITFPIVWTILYILMGISSYLIETSNAPWDEKRSALTVYGVSLFFNFLWTILFFNLKLLLFSFIWLLALIALVIYTVCKYFKISKPAAYLQIPYLLWCCFAAFLNIGIYLLN